MTLMPDNHDKGGGTVSVCIYSAYATIQHGAKIRSSHLTITQFELQSSCQHWTFHYSQSRVVEHDAGRMPGAT